MFDNFCNLITNRKFEATFAKYNMICKVANFCTFGIDQVSNTSHSHACYELCIILEGNGKFICGDTTYHIKAGNIIIADPYEYHEIYSKDTDGLTLLYIFVDLITRLEDAPLTNPEDVIIDNFLRKHSHNVFSNKNLFYYFDFINNYHSCTRTFNYTLLQIVKTMVLECLSLLTPDKHTQELVEVPTSILEKAQDYIDKNLHKKIYVEDIANHCLVSTRYLQQIFKRDLNTTIIDYITTNKIKLACHYLLNHFTISDTANLVGMPDISNFNRVFKKVTGFTPSNLQKLSKYNSGFGRRL